MFAEFGTVILLRRRASQRKPGCHRRYHHLRPSSTASAEWRSRGRAKIPSLKTNDLSAASEWQPCQRQHKCGDADTHSSMMLDFRTLKESMLLSTGHDVMNSWACGEQASFRTIPPATFVITTATI